MAESEGFEPPIALRLCLISSQVHSTGLCQLSTAKQLPHCERSLQPFSVYRRRCIDGNAARFGHRALDVNRFVAIKPIMVVQSL